MIAHTFPLPTWNLLCELVGSPDFLYVAECKLASMENLKHIASRGGRFVMVLPRGRKQDKQFRQRLSESPESVPWEACLEKKDDQDRLVDRVRVCAEETLCEAGWRLWWYHSSAKQHRDAAKRTRAVEQANKQLRELNERLSSPRTRFRSYGKVRPAVQEILDRCEVGEWLKVRIHEDSKEILRQAKRGRPGPDTQYIHDRYEFRYRLTWSIDAEALSRAEAEDGVFPLISNAPLTAEQTLAWNFSGCGVRASGGPDGPEESHSARLRRHRRGHAASFRHEASGKTRMSPSGGREANSR